MPAVHTQCADARLEGARVLSADGLVFKDIATWQKSADGTGKRHTRDDSCAGGVLTQMAKTIKLRPGAAIDLTVADPGDGQPWALNNPQKQRKAFNRIQKDRSLLLIGGPMCVAFSRIWDRLRLGAAREETVKGYGRKCLRFAIELYQMQRLLCLCFLHEHPAWQTVEATLTCRGWPANRVSTELLGTCVPTAVLQEREREG